MKKQNEKHLITTAEAAELLGVSRRRINAMITAGQIPATRVGRDWLMDNNELYRLGLNYRQPGRPRKTKQ